MALPSEIDPKALAHISYHRTWFDTPAYQQDRTFNNPGMFASYTSYSHSIALGSMGRTPYDVACELKDPWIWASRPMFETSHQRQEKIRMSKVEIAIGLGKLLLEKLDQKDQGFHCTGFLNSIESLMWEFARAVHELEQYNEKFPQLSASALLAECASPEAAPGTFLGNLRDQYVQRCFSLQTSTRAVAAGKKDPNPDWSIVDLTLDQLRTMYMEACSDLKKFDDNCWKVHQST